MFAERGTSDGGRAAARAVRTPVWTVPTELRSQMPREVTEMADDTGCEALRKEVCVACNKAGLR